MSVELIKTFIEYHLDMTRCVWDSINEITDEQFRADDAYSRGSIRNLMVHLASTDRRCLEGLKSQPDVGHLKFEDFPTLLRTDRNGWIELTTDGEQMWGEVEKKWM